MYIVGIAGGSGSGKTTFASKIIEKVTGTRVMHLHQDSYYLEKLPKDDFINKKPNYDHPSAFDWKLLRKHFAALKKNKRIEAPVYDFVSSSRLAQTVKIGPGKVCIFDGIYALYDPLIRDMLDLKIFLHVDADIRFIRRLHRDVRERGRNLDGIIDQYYDMVRPMHRQYLEPTSIYADLVVGEDTDRAAEVVASHISAHLR